jgi:hypothetical protein
MFGINGLAHLRHGVDARQGCGTSTPDPNARPAARLKRYRDGIRRWRGFLFGRSTVTPKASCSARLAGMDVAHP